MRFLLYATVPSLCANGAQRFTVSISTASLRHFFNYLTFLPMLLRFDVLCRPLPFWPFLVLVIIVCIDRRYAPMLLDMNATAAVSSEVLAHVCTHTTPAPATALNYNCLRVYLLSNQFMHDHAQNDPRKALYNLREQTTDQQYDAALNTLLLITNNIVREPTNAKFTTLKLNAPKLYERVTR